MDYNKVISSVVNNIQSIDEKSKNQECSTVITNVQSSVIIMGENMVLPLKSLINCLSGMAKYEPKKFAAIIIRAYFGVHVTTCMLFESGKLVVIGALSVEHSRYASQMYRILISNIVAKYYDKEHKTHIRSNLINRTLFNNFGIHNIVAKTYLGYRLKLKRFKDAKQRNARFEPESFPGCPFLVWVEPKSMCTCETKKESNESCICNVNTSLFDSGNVILTGSKTIENTNRAKHKLMSFTKEFIDNDKILPKNERYEARRQDIFNTSVENTGYVKQRTINDSIKLSREQVLDLLPSMPTPKTEYDHVENLFVKACLLERIELVRHLYTIDNGCVLDALEYIHNMKEKTTYIENIEKILKNK